MSIGTVPSKYKFYGYKEPVYMLMCIHIYIESMYVTNKNM